MDIWSKFAVAGVLLLLTLVFGVWLSLAGKPYNGILFNIHKLVALGLVIVAGIQIYQALKSSDAQFLLIAIMVLAVLCVIALFASGALLSIGTPQYDLVLTIHRIALVVMPVALATTVFLLKA